MCSYLWIDCNMKHSLINKTLLDPLLLVNWALLGTMYFAGCARSTSATDMPKEKPEIADLFQAWEKLPITPYLNCDPMVLRGPNGIQDTFMFNAFGWWSIPGSKLYPDYGANLGYEGMVIYPVSQLGEGYPLASSSIIFDVETEVRQPFIRLQKYPNREKIWELRLVFRDFVAEWKIPGRFPLRHADTLDIGGKRITNYWILGNQNTHLAAKPKDHIKQIYWTAEEGLVGYVTQDGSEWGLASRY